MLNTPTSWQLPPSTISITIVTKLSHLPSIFQRKGHTLNFWVVWQTPNPHRSTQTAWNDDTKTHDFTCRSAEVMGRRGLGLINFQMTDWSHPSPLNEVSLREEKVSVKAEVDFCSPFYRPINCFHPNQCFQFPPKSTQLQKRDLHCSIQVFKKDIFQIYLRKNIFCWNFSPCFWSKVPHKKRRGTVHVSCKLPSKTLGVFCSK